MTRKLDSSVVDVDQVVLISLAQLAARLGRSKRQVQRYLHEGKLLPPIRRLSRNPQWRLDEVVRWMQADCPDQQEWLRMKGA